NTGCSVDRADSPGKERCSFFFRSPTAANLGSQQPRERALSLRYLFGPVTSRFAEQNLQGPRRAGWCKTFGPAGSDVPTLASDSWPAVCDRLPPGWRPDAVVLHLASAVPPEWVWSAQVPVVGLVTGCPLI